MAVRDTTRPSPKIHQSARSKKVGHSTSTTKIKLTTNSRTTWIRTSEIMSNKSVFSSRDASELAKIIHFLAPILYECTITISKEGINIYAMTNDLSVHVWLPHKAEGDSFDSVRQSVTIGVDLNALAGWMRSIKSGLHITFTIDHDKPHDVTKLPLLHFTRTKKDDSCTSTELVNLNIDQIVPDKDVWTFDNIVSLQCSQFDSMLSSHLSNHTQCAIGISQPDKVTGKSTLTFRSYDPILEKKAETIIKNLKPVGHAFQPYYESENKAVVISEESPCTYDVKRIKRINRSNYCRELMLAMTQASPLVLCYMLRSGGYIEFRILSIQEIQSMAPQQSMLPSRGVEKKIKRKRVKFIQENAHKDTEPQPAQKIVKRKRKKVRFSDESSLNNVSLCE